MIIYRHIFVFLFSIIAASNIDLVISILHRIYSTKRIFNPYKKPIPLLYVAPCTQSMQRTWWPVGSTTIVTGSYWNINLLQEIMRRFIILRSCLQGSLRVHPWWLLDGRPHQRPQFQTAKQVPMTSLVTLTQMLVKVRIDYVSQFRSIFCANSMIYWSLSARLLYLQCWCTGDTAVLLLVINMLCKNDDSRGLLRYDILAHMILIPQWNFIYSAVPCGGTGCSWGDF